jgi:hypothetical protein
VSDLTLLVRLNETVDVRPPSVPAGGGPQSMPNVLLLVGEVGEGTIYTGSFSEKKTFFLKTPQKEVARAGNFKRIVNPDDPDQHVDVANTRAVITKEGSGQDYKKVVHRYQDFKMPNETEVPADSGIGKSWNFTKQAGDDGDLIGDLGDLGGGE